MDEHGPFIVDLPIDSMLVSHGYGPVYQGVAPGY